jgi:hypothetical protein
MYSKEQLERLKNAIQDMRKALHSKKLALECFEKSLAIQPSDNEIAVKCQALCLEAIKELKEKIAEGDLIVQRNTVFNHTTQGDVTH